MGALSSAVFRLFLSSFCGPAAHDVPPSYYQCHVQRLVCLLFCDVLIFRLKQSLRHGMICPHETKQEDAVGVSQD